jgi:uncharacterized protein (DUF433 family)
VVARSTRDKIRELNDRTALEGTVDRKRFTSGNRRVFAGTRVPVSGVLDFLKAGYASDAILREFPDLLPGDIAAARAELEGRAA